jgi:hypothetical protein
MQDCTILPRSGPSAGGIEVEIIGLPIDTRNVESISFGEQEGRIAGRASEWAVTVITPPGSGKVPISLVVRGLAEPLVAGEFHYV